MKLDSKPTQIAGAISVLCALTLLFAFQNCSPALPLDGVVSNSSVYVRPTATPGATPQTGGGPSLTPSPIYDGTCIDNPVTYPMAKLGTDVLLGGTQLTAFTTNDGTGNVAFWQLADGSISHASVCTLGNTFSLYAIGDFDGDLLKDALWIDSSGKLVLWIMRGATRTASYSIGTIPSGQNVIGVVDIDGDGKDDLLMRDASNNIGAILVHGATTISAPVALGPVTATTHFKAASTFFDTVALRTKVALIFNDTAAATYPLWLMSGTTVQTNTTVPAGLFSYTFKNSAGTDVTHACTLKGIGDFSGDHDFDFLLVDNETGYWVVKNLQYNAAGPTMAYKNDVGPIAPPIPTWSFLDVARVNGDITTDWRFLVYGETYPYLMYLPNAANSVGGGQRVGYVRPGYSLFTYSHD